MDMTDFDSPLPDWLSNTFPVKAATKLYSSVIRYRNNRYERDLSLSFKTNRKVISVGGIRAGGTGKTPAAIMVGQCLESKGLPFAFLSRGYKRKEKEYRIILPNEKTDWEQIGDEPAMIHDQLPQSWLGIGPDRVRNAQSLSEITPKETVFILDDGFQHRRLKRDLDIVCINESTLNDRLLPQGYLRENISSLQRAHVLFLTGSADRCSALESVMAKLQTMFPHLHSFIIIHEPQFWKNVKTGEISQNLPLENPVAICGIANPQRFFEILDTQGIEPCEKKIFPDHYNYTEHDIRSMHKLYSSGIVTTEKDMCRLQKFNVVMDFEFWYLKIRSKFLNADSLNRFNKLLDKIVLNT